MEHGTHILLVQIGTIKRWANPHIQDMFKVKSSSWIEMKKVAVLKAYQK